MADFLLIHGSCHGAWCWREIIPLLQAAGHTANAIDLPGREGGEVAKNASLAGNAAAILDAIKTPTILVGHSLAGMSISAAAEAAPDKISHLIYLAAWLPKNQDSARLMREAAGCPALVEAMKITKDGFSSYFDPSFIPETFYHDCPPEAVNFAMKNLCTEPLPPQREPVKLGENFASVDKSYIRCTQDRAIPADVQFGLAGTLPANRRHSLPSAHSPFFSHPQDLAALLIKIATN